MRFIAVVVLATDRLGVLDLRCFLLGQSRRFTRPRAAFPVWSALQDVLQPFATRESRQYAPEGARLLVTQFERGPISKRNEAFRAKSPASLGVGRLGDMLARVLSRRSLGALALL